MIPVNLMHAAELSVARVVRALAGSRFGREPRSGLDERPVIAVSPYIIAGRPIRSPTVVIVKVLLRRPRDRLVGFDAWAVFDLLLGQSHGVLVADIIGVTQG